jgi:hypothetical protein
MFLTSNSTAILHLNQLSSFRGTSYRTEARWAVFFDSLGLKWDYEAEGYVLPDGTWYLPDFKLILSPDQLIYCEIKPEEFDDFNDEELAKLRHLSNQLNCDVLLLTGVPDYRAYQQILPHTEQNALSLAFFQDYAPYVRTVDQYWLQLLRFDETTGRMFFEMDERRLGKAFGRNYLEAVKSARAARFEHGEMPGKRQ